MNNKDYRLSQTKHKLKQLKERRVKFVIWKLTVEQKEYIESLGYKVVPYLYEVQTKMLKNFATVHNSKLKEIHYAYKKGKRTMVLKLNKEDMRALEDKFIKFRPIKFKIILNLTS